MLRWLLMGDIDDSDFWVRPSKVMEWSNEAALALVDEYRKHPVLWDVRDPSYSCKKEKMEAWQAVAAKLQLDVFEVKQKMCSLLGSFRREKSKIRKSRDPLNGSTYSTKWFAFEKMQFLLRDEESGITGIKLEEEEEDSIFDELAYPSQEEAEQSQSKAPSPLTLKRPRKFEKTETSNDFTLPQQNDEYGIFGQYIACKLRKFDRRTRAFVERAINNVLFEADMGKYDHLPSTLDSSRHNWGVNVSTINHVSSRSPTFDRIGDIPQ